MLACWAGTRSGQQLMTQVEIAEDAPGFAHPALFYQGPSEYRAGTVPFIREGLAADVPVTVVAPDLGCGCSATRWAPTPNGSNCWT